MTLTPNSSGLTAFLLACDAPRERAHEILDSLDRDIKRADARVKRVFIEVQNECPPAAEAPLVTSRRELAADPALAGGSRAAH